MIQKFNPLTEQFDLVNDAERFDFVQSGHYYCTNSPSNNTVTLLANTTYLLPIWVGKILSAGFKTNSSFTGTGIFRLACYSHDEKTNNLTLIHDLNTVTATAASTTYFAALPAAETFNKKIFLAINLQSTTGVASVYSAISSNANNANIRNIILQLAGTTNLLQISMAMKNENVSSGFPISYSFESLTLSSAQSPSLFAEKSA